MDSGAPQIQDTMDEKIKHCPDTVAATGASVSGSMGKDPDTKLAEGLQPKEPPDINLSSDRTGSDQLLSQPETLSTDPGVSKQESSPTIVNIEKVNDNKEQTVTKEGKSTPEETLNDPSKKLETKEELETQQKEEATANTEQNKELIRGLKAPQIQESEPVIIADKDEKEMTLSQENMTVEIRKEEQEATEDTHMNKPEDGVDKEKRDTEGTHKGNELAGEDKEESSSTDISDTKISSANNSTGHKVENSKVEKTMNGTSDKRPLTLEERVGTFIEEQKIKAKVEKDMSETTLKERVVTFIADDIQGKPQSGEHHDQAMAIVTGAMVSAINIVQSDIGKENNVPRPLTMEERVDSSNAERNVELKGTNDADPSQELSKENQLDKLSNIKEHMEYATDSNVSKSKQVSNEILQNQRSVDANEITKQILDGSIPYDQLPALSKRVVRIFVSSTFSDTKEERNAFMEHVYPKVAKLCRDRFGLEFQVVDMRWGVPEQASDNHSTTELCLQEIRKCQQVSVGPNFVAILGNKYGYRPIPSTISTEEFQILSDIAKTSNDSRWQTVEEWYLRDDNSIPAKYVLEAISAKLKDYNNMDNSELKKAAKDKWNKTEVTLTETLRDNANKAHGDSKISDQQRHKYFMSVTEDEVHQGIIDSSQSQTKDTSLCIIRSIPDIKNHIHTPKAPKFIDIDGKEIDPEAEGNLKDLRESKVPPKLPEDNVINISIEWAASGGNVSLETGKGSEVINVEKEKDTGYQNLEKHKKYLDGLCDQFYQKLVKMVNAGGTNNRQVYDEINTEVLQHLHFSRQRCEVFEGREDVIAAVKAYLNSKTTTPLTIHGNSGCGKTSVMAKVMAKMKTWTSGPSGKKKTIICIVRYLGTTPSTSNVQGLLVSLCKQIAKVYGVEWEEPERFPQLITSFHHMLTMASKDTPLLVVLDSIDQLMTSFDAFNLKWLPKQLPLYVKMVLSTIDEGYPIKDKISEIYCHKARFVDIQPLGDEVGMTIINKWLKQQNRCVTPKQQSIVMRALAKCSLPLYARIAFNQIISWRSFDILTDQDLENTVKGAINRLYEQMENKLGVALVKHSLAYFTAARYGLSEVEMEHLLSLDDELLNDIYKFWKPPIRRVPPLLWTRVRNEISNYVVERAADGLLVMNWYHRQFIEATRERYLSDDKFNSYIHTVMTEFFDGKWGGGTEKPFEYTQAQKARFVLQDVKSKADRKVPLQPYSFVYNTDGENQVRYNERKLSELPWHLLKADNTEALCREVFFSYEWLYSKLKATSATALIQELELHMSESKVLAQNKSLQILVATLHLIRPYITKYPESLPIELSGRLAKYIDSDEMLTGLVKQCDSLGTSHCPIIPLLTCFQMADLGLRQNINIRSTTPIEDSGGLTCTSDFKTMYIVDYDELGKSVMSVWETETGEKIAEHIIQKDIQEGTLDYFLDCTLTIDEKFLMVFYRLKYSRGIKQTEEKYNHKAYSGEGFIDIVDVKNGQLIRTIKEFLYKDDFYNALTHQTKNWIVVRFGWKIPLIEIHGEHVKSLTEAHYLSSNENVIAMIRTKKDMLCKPSEEEENKVKARSKTTIIRDFKTKDLLAELERSDDMSGVVMTHDNKILILADMTGKVQMYGINRIGVGKRNQKKIIATLTIPFHETILVFAEAKENFKRVVLLVSPNDQFVMAIYQGREGWESFLWDIQSGKFVGRVTNVMPLKARYPNFSYDSSCIVVSTQTKIQLYSCMMACKAREYDLEQNIRDLKVSVTSSDVAVLLSKDVVFLKAECDARPEGSRKQLNKSISASTIDSEVLIDKELSTEMHPAILFDTIRGIPSEDHSCLDIEELGLLNSARSQKRSPVDSCITPDGTKAVQLLLRKQIIDTKSNEIKYSPKSGDIILRPYTNSTGDVINEEISLNETDSAHSKVVELKESDRIVGEANKVKYRAQGVQPGQIKIMLVPSVLTISGYKDRALKRLHRITVYNEAILTVTNKYIVTTKKSSAGDYVNVYDISTAQLVTTHMVNGICSTVTFFDNDRQMAVTAKDIVLKLYGDSSFVKCTDTFEIGKVKGITSKRMIVREVMSFKNNSWCLLLRLTEEGFNTFGVSLYIHVDLKSKLTSPLLSVKPKLEDISKDGSLGIDSHLALYSLPQGCIVKQIPYLNTNPNMQLQARISDDNRHIVFVDKQDDTLHVVCYDNYAACHLVSCHTHAPSMPSVDGLSLRQHGQIIVIRGAAKLGIFLIVDSAQKKVKIDYSTEFKRAISLVPQGLNDVLQHGIVTTSIETEPKTKGPAVEDFLSALGSW